MTRFRSDATLVIGLVLSTNEYGLIHESIKATIKNFQNKKDASSQEIAYEFQKILESIEKQAKTIVEIY